MYGKIAIQLYSVRNHMENLEGVKNTFAKLREIGYTQAQTAGLNCDVVDFAAAAHENGIEIIGTHCDLPKDPHNIDEYVEMHRILGTKNAGVGGGGFDHTSESLLKYIDSVNALAENLATYGMKFTYHHHSWEFGKIDGKRIIDYMADGFDNKNVSFVLDTYWLNHAGSDINTWLEKLAGRVDILHLKDKMIPLGTNDGVITEVGNGNIDFVSIVKKAEDTGVKYLCVEQDDWPQDRDSLECAKISFDYLSGILA